MGRKLLFITFILTHVMCFSQSKGIKCIYESRMEVPEGVYEIGNKATVDKLIKDHNEDRRVYSLEVGNGFYQFKKLPESIQRVDLEIEALDYYINFNDSTFAKQYANWGEKKYIIKGKAKSLKWNITGNTKEIDGRNCTEATLEGEDDVTAWFTTEVPFGYAPLGYYGLPGLAVKLSTPYYDLYLKEIHEEGAITFKEPTDGKIITEKDVDKKSDTDKKEWEDKASKIIK